MQPTPNQVIVDAKSLTRIYQLGASEVTGIENVDLEIDAGEFVVLKGNSGSGKSTLLSLLAGLDQPTRGSLKVVDVNLHQATRTELIRYRREVVGMVFQSFNLLPTLTVIENVCLPALLAGRPYAETHAEASKWLQWLQLHSRLDHFPSQLSGGEMQRTAIARALINDPILILADEPTGNLDSRNGQIVVDLLAELNNRWKRTVIIATHSNLADAYASLHVCLKDGKVTDVTCEA